MALCGISITARLVIDGVRDWENFKRELIVFVEADRVDLIRLLIYNAIVERDARQIILLRGECLSMHCCFRHLVEADDFVDAVPVVDEGID